MFLGENNDNRNFRVGFRKNTHVIPSFMESKSFQKDFQEYNGFSKLSNYYVIKIAYIILTPNFEGYKKHI